MCKVSKQKTKKAYNQINVLGKPKIKTKNFLNLMAIMEEM
jgi:hypothetical protein